MTEAERAGGGAFVFLPPTNPVETPNPAQWWRFVRGANWRHPHGPHTDLRPRHAQEEALAASHLGFRTVAIAQQPGSRRRRR